MYNVTTRIPANPERPLGPSAVDREGRIAEVTLSFTSARSADELLEMLDGATAGNAMTVAGLVGDARPLFPSRTGDGRRPALRWHAFVRNRDGSPIGPRALNRLAEFSRSGIDADARLLPSRVERARAPVIDISHLRADERRAEPRLGTVLRRRRRARLR